MKSIYIVPTLLLLMLFSACKKMDSTYKQYIVVGGNPYTGKAKSPKAYAGHNRVKITWLRGSDPNVTKARIFWNNYTDSVEVNIKDDADTISVIIDNLPERDYSFEIETYDKNGVPSIPVELLSGAFGDRYQSQLLTRPVNSVLLDKKDKITIKWGNADISNGAISTELQYTDLSGMIKSLRFPVTESSSILTDAKPGTALQYRTVFEPDTLSIDEFYTASSDLGEISFDKKDWSIIDFSSQHSAGDNAVINFIDGTDATRWHTCAGCSTYPHFATIDMGVERTITKFGVWRTTFENGGDDRAADQIQFLTSVDNVNWTDQGIYPFNRMINGEQDYVMLSQPTARYFKFVGVAGPQSYMVIGEISAYGF
jgi:hypothetical protein